jgi:hypothetical protein
MISSRICSCVPARVSQVDRVPRALVAARRCACRVARGLDRRLSAVSRLVTLREAVFRDTVFNPSRRPGRSPPASFAAAPGTTTHETFARRIATITNRATETTISGSVWPRHLDAGAGVSTEKPGVQGVSRTGHDEWLPSGSGGGVRLGWQRRRAPSFLSAL